MSGSAGLVGASGAPYPVPIELGKIREMAAATKARSASYWTTPAPVIPPTFLAAAKFWAAPESSPLDDSTLDWSRVLHGSQEYVFHGPPPRAGDALTAQQRVEDVFEKYGKRGGTMTFTVLVTDFRDSTGRLVAEARSTVIVTSKATGEDS